MASFYINGRKYSGSTWYDIGIAHKIENNEGSVPSSAVVSKLNDKLNETAQMIQTYDTLSSFPTTGKENVLYIETETNKAYRWDDENIRFYCVGSDYNEINIIDGSFE